MAGQIEVIYGPMFSGKCLAEGTLVAMASGGLRPVEAVSVGEELMGDDLKPRRVLQTASGVDLLYRVWQDNGAHYVVNGSHVLSLKKRGEMEFADVPIAQFRTSAELLHDWVGYAVVPQIFGGLTLAERRAELAPMTAWAEAGHLKSYLQDFGRVEPYDPAPPVSLDRWAFLVRSVGGDESPAFVTPAGVEAREHRLRVEAAGVGRYFGFVLDGNHRFVLGNCAVTHNTTELIRRIKRQVVARRECVVVKYTKDKRYTSKAAVATHDQQTYSSLVKSELMPSLDELLGYEVIGIDEGQFFEDVVEFAETAANAGKTVIVAALDGDFARRPFGRILELVPRAENITKLTAICMRCQKEAAFSLRTAQSKELMLIGGGESYEAVCRKCYLKFCGPSEQP